MSPLSVSFAATLVLVASALVSTDSNSDSCTVLSQSLRDLKYEHASTLQNMSSIHSKLSTLSDTESNDQNSLSERLLNRKQAVVVAEELVHDIKRAQSTLRERKQTAASLNTVVNQTLVQLRESEKRVARIRVDLQELANQKENIEARSRQHELRIQMLINDVDAANHTALDAWSVFTSRVDDAATKLRETKKLLVDVMTAKKEWDKSAEIFGVSSQKVDKIKKDISEVQNTLFMKSQDKSEKRRKFDLITRQAESDRVDSMRKLYEIEKFRNETLLKSKRRIETIHRESESVSAELNATKTGLIKISVSGDDAHKMELAPELNISSLRAEIQDSRRVLSHAGYANRFSLLQGNTISQPQKDIGALDSAEKEALYFRDAARILHLQEQLNHLETEETSVGRSFKSGLNSAHESLKELNELTQKIVAEDSEIEQRRISLHNATLRTRALELNMKELRQNLQENQVEMGNNKKKADESRRKYEDQLAQFISANASLTDTVNGARNSEGDYRQKVGEMRKTKREQANIRKAAKADAYDLYAIETSMGEKRHLLTNLTDSTKNLSDELEEQRKEETEVLADISQITRRLEEKLSAYEQESTKVRKLDIEVTDLESQIQQNLAVRKRLDEELDMNIKRKFELEDKMEETTNQLTSLRCN
jgi:hypothetical protein